MIKKLLLLPLLIILFGVTAFSQDISGSWSWNSKEGGDMFTIDLSKASENQFSGNHCSVFLHGDRIDCSDSKDEFSIVLIRKAENIFQGSIRSDYSKAIGNVQLQYLPVENTIIFSLKTAPQGIYYMPVEARMIRN
jgi:hypothetical protein